MRVVTIVIKRCVRSRVRARVRASILACACACEYVFERVRARVRSCAIKRDAKSETTFVSKNQRYRWEIQKDNCWCISRRILARFFVLVSMYVSACVSIHVYLSMYMSPRLPMCVYMSIKAHILFTNYLGTPSMLTQSFLRPCLGWLELRRQNSDFRGRRFWISTVLGMHINEKWWKWCVVFFCLFSLSNLVSEV